MTNLLCGKLWRQGVLMIYRGPGFLADATYDLAPCPPQPSPVSKLDRRHTGRLKKKDNLLSEEGGGRRGAESYDRKKVWSSINHSILSAEAYTSSEAGLTDNPIFPLNNMTRFYENFTQKHCLPLKFIITVQNGKVTEVKGNMHSL
jgi:hypothetical protein